MLEPLYVCCRKLAMSAAGWVSATLLSSVATSTGNWPASVQMWGATAPPPTHQQTTQNHTVFLSRIFSIPWVGYSMQNKRKQLMEDASDRIDQSFSRFEQNSKQWDTVLASKLCQPSVATGHAQNTTASNFANVDDCGSSLALL